MRRLFAIACVVSTACGPRVAGSTGAAETETDGASDASSSEAGSETAAGDDSTTGLVQVDCPCERIEPARTVCEPSRTEVVDALREPIELAAMPADDSAPVVLVDGGIVVEVSPPDGPHALHRWTPGDAAFVEVAALEDGVRLEAMTAAGDALLLLMTRSGDEEDVLARWTAAGGLEPIVGLGSIDASLVSDGSNWQRIRVANDHALLGVSADDHFEVAAPETYAVVDVDLATGTWELLPEPLSGWAPTPDGWVGLRPRLALFQYCFDYSCFREDIATTWDLVTSAGKAPLAIAACVEEDLLGTLVGHAWLLGTDYVFTVGTAVRRISAGTTIDLWRGDATVVGALVHEDALVVSVTGDPEKQVLRVPLDGGPAESLLRHTPDDSRRHFHLAGILDDRLHLRAPSGDTAWELVAIDL